MAKIKHHVTSYEGVIFTEQYHYFCKGCGHIHAFELKEKGGHHLFNMDLDKPTVQPSLLENRIPGKVCHSFIENGFIRYLGDCWHELKDQTIALPEIETWPSTT